MMPKLDGISVVRELKRDAKLKAIPVILVTAKADTRDIVAGLDAGGDDYLTKPFEHAALLARVRSMLRQKALHDTVQDQARELAEWNTALEGRVAEQVDQIERIGRLRRFLPPQVADLIVASADHEMLLGSHRQEVTVVFCDLRGFTAFAEKAQPDAVMAVLAEYHAALGALILAYEGTLERFLGDGLLVLFNDPMPCPTTPSAPCAWPSTCRPGSARSPRAGATPVTTSASASASPREKRRSAGSVSTGASIMRRSGGFRTSLRVFAARPRPGRCWSASRYSCPSSRGSRQPISATSC